LSPSSQSPLSDVAILTRALENVFRKLIRMLLGKMSLKKMQEMIQVIFVEEAESMLKKETPGKNVALSTLSVVTGYDTRTISRIKSSDSYLRPFHTETRFLNEITPECSVLDVWESNQNYLDDRTGKPRELVIKGVDGSFQTLINEAVSARGVTVGSFLRRLQSSESIELSDDGNRVRMIDKRYTPFKSQDQMANIKIGMAAVGNLVETITHNLDAPGKSNDAFYQRGCWTHRLSKSESEMLRSKVSSFLLDTDDKARKMMRPFEQKDAADDQITAGISMFYFEEEPQS